MCKLDIEPNVIGIFVSLWLSHDSTDGGVYKGNRIGTGTAPHGTLYNRLHRLNKKDLTVITRQPLGKIQTTVGP